MKLGYGAILAFVFMSFIARIGIATDTGDWYEVIEGATFALAASVYVVTAMERDELRAKLKEKRRV